MAAAVIRRCHSCKAQLMKSEGCNKLTCRCGAKMCYICKTPVKDYSHFCVHARFPGYKCDKCKACFLWEDADKVDKVKVEEIKKQAEADLAALGTGQVRQVGVDESKFQPPPVQSNVVRVPGPFPPVARVALPQVNVLVEAVPNPPQPPMVPPPIRHRHHNR